MEHENKMSNVLDQGKKLLVIRREYYWTPNIYSSTVNIVDTATYPIDKGVEHYDLLILDGSDPAQIQWGVRNKETKQSITLVLTKGCASEFLAKYCCEFSEDKDNFYIKTFCIKECPAIIRHVDGKILIREFSIR